MAVKTEWLTTQTSDGPMRVYVARPDDGKPHPGVIVIQEVFGVNDNVQDVTRRFAEEGFVGAAPEIFHRFETLQVPYSESQAALALRNRLTDDQVTEDVQATLSLLMGLPDVRNQKIGIVGFCYGGRVSYLAATRIPELRAAVPYYGGKIVADDASAPVNASANIQAPLLLLFGELDQSIPPAQIQLIDETLTRLGKPHEIKVYPGAGHGFMCADRPSSYNADAAADAFPRTVAFFRKHLGA